jgi:hypothetical protein
MDVLENGVSMRAEVLGANLGQFVRQIMPINAQPAAIAL